VVNNSAGFCLDRRAVELYEERRVEEDVVGVRVRATVRVFVPETDVDLT
jgi:hypothetical protein